MNLSVGGNTFTPSLFQKPKVRVERSLWPQCPREIQTRLSDVYAQVHVPIPPPGKPCEQVELWADEEWNQREV